MAKMSVFIAALWIGTLAYCIKVPLRYKQTGSQNLLSDPTIALPISVKLTGYEYVVVDSGAGGGPLAAGLAIRGHSVLLIEAGDDQKAKTNTKVLAFHLKATEDEALSWDFCVRHWRNLSQQRKDEKMVWETPAANSQPFSR